MSEIIEAFEDTPVIPCVKDYDSLQRALASESKVVFIIYDDLLSITSTIKRIKKAGKYVFVNVDLIEGCSSSEILLKYLMANTDIDGIMSTKISMINIAKRIKLNTVMRYFVIDSHAYKKLEGHLARSKPDFLEVLPGWPKIIAMVKDNSQIPIIAGGMLNQKDDIIEALKAGALSASSSEQSLWFE